MRSSGACMTAAIWWRPRSACEAARRHLLVLGAGAIARGARSLGLLKPLLTLPWGRVVAAALCRHHQQCEHEHETNPRVRLQLSEMGLLTTT
jgi:hypothetical protein